MVRITRSQRDALRNEVLTSLTGVGDIYLLLNKGDWLRAMEHRERFDRDFQMLDQLGWHPEDEQDAYTLDIPPHQLAAFASHYLARMDGCLADGVQTLLHGDLIPTDPGDLSEEEARQDVRDRIDRDLEIRTVCKSILDALERACAFRVPDGQRDGGESAVAAAYAHVVRGYEAALTVPGLPLVEVEGPRAVLRAARELEGSAA